MTYRQEKVRNPENDAPLLGQEKRFKKTNYALRALSRVHCSVGKLWMANF